MIFIKDKYRTFKNGIVYLAKTEDNYPVETTDTFLPYYTKNAIGRKQNKLINNDLGNRSERWMIGVSCQSGCPVHCKFCGTGRLRKYRNLTSKEIIEQIEYVINNNRDYNPNDSKEFKINLTRMGEPFLNIDNVKEAINIIKNKYPNTHFYLSTVGIKNSDYSWIKDNITLQISLHSLDESKRNWLIPYINKLSIEELGNIRTNSRLKTTINLTLVDEKDFDISILKRYFDPKYFFIKLSPLNINKISDKNKLNGIIQSNNLI